VRPAMPLPITTALPVGAVMVIVVVGVFDDALDEADAAALGVPPAAAVTAPAVGCAGVMGKLDLA
jgi:hypothetical protein